MLSTVMLSVRCNAFSCNVVCEMQCFQLQCCLWDALLSAAMFSVRCNAFSCNVFCEMHIAFLVFMKVSNHISDGLCSLRTVEKKFKTKNSTKEFKTKNIMN